ncbi:geminin coiled-coil domain-containing protein 1 [Scomber japonicus]|uniref:geminin coiled-coil domain-containing protein 1 n=1 Tax=Scomber japonicus TaxID=13676 RepID=UPI00230541B9|nr:geminin coiled-coil domain-containing protein 1 [Scomber japonicus]
METLASLWARDLSDPCDLIAPEEERHEPSSVWVSEAQCVLNCSPPAAGLMWTEQLSPHLQRNKQLQDTLLQREEELARLQEENNKLREFLDSSFVRNLEEKAKKLTADGRKKLKRNLMYVSDGPLHGYRHHHPHHHHHPHQSSQQVSKRVCRNLTAEFSSDFSETSDASSSEPNLDLWVLRTLGLKDRDTIDTSNDSSSSSGFSLGGLVYDTSVTSSSPSEYCEDPAVSNSASNCSSPPDQRSDFTSCGLSRRCDAPAALIGSYDSIAAFNSPLTRETPEICSQRPEGSPADPSAYWSPLKLNRTPSQDTIQFSPPAEGVYYSPISSSSPVVKQTWRPMRSRSRSPLSPSVGSQAPRSQTELAFSMCLSPSSSVKTHSFPQGQAFVRKDNEGRWNFTWLPRQGP